jgi:transposase
MDTEGLPPHPKKGVKTKSLVGFLDEAGFSDRPSVRKTWARKGKTPIVKTAGGWKSRSVIGTIVATAKGERPRYFGTIKQKAVRSSDIVEFLRNLKRHLHGKKLILFWDGLRAHTSKETTHYVESQSSWLAIERTPTYAPEVNPAEYGWSSMKTKDMANTCSKTTNELDQRIKKSIRRLQRSPQTLKGFLRASGLFG